ncbi:MAG: type II toxin-antitoxin system HipA family toxin [Desulfuromusa sp.]|jgi:serine/threonine-protein kinase HipA|nr:type II toxin-antitoxin system HipA family toxin [Desulfuromusa sp.]
MVKPRDQIWVWLDDPDFGPLQHIGILSRGVKGSISFAYQDDWLLGRDNFPLDPELDMFAGEFYPRNSNFGVFMDSCPDRWGQVLMKRRETIVAKEAGRVLRTLDAWDFLLGIQDCTRMGALRYSRPDEENYLSDEELAAPPVSKISELQEIAYELTKKKLASPEKIKEWLKVLVAPGASLGGARPKANIEDETGHLWIAKFPSANDEYDVALWEKLLHDLAYDCGINVPDSQVLQVGSGYHTFMVKRFDRNRTDRYFYVSAMTMLNHIDSEDANYLELANFISTMGVPGTIKVDLKELFTRVVFNVATANRDDHLRNHGFIRKPSGWILSPAFDMNPSFKKEEHVLSIDTDQHDADIQTVINTAPFYRLSESEAGEITEKVLGIISGWRTRARRLGLSSYDCDEAEHLFLAK